jgi:N-methylhydantoinase A
MTFDMGGTSTDVALCAGKVSVTHEALIDGMPVGIPVIDIHTVGAGGGSIAALDLGGALKVGPASAGASPGPICYGRGGKDLTVTDANVLLGRLPPRFFLGGTAPLAVEQIPSTMQRLTWTANWNSAQHLAQGIVDVVNNNMEQALRLISVERGHDPRDFTLVSFGGAGGLHAADLARSLGIPQVLVPIMPGALSALGLLLADAQRDYSRSLLIPLEGADDRLRHELGALHAAGIAGMKAEGFDENRIYREDFVDLRYAGQSYDLTVPAGANLARRFHRMHESRYGYADPARSIEVVSVRTTFYGRVPKIRFDKQKRARSKPVALETAAVWFSGRPRRTAIYERSGLLHGHTIQGPAIIGEYSATTLVPPDFRCEVDPYGNLLLCPKPHSK